MSQTLSTLMGNVSLKDFECKEGQSEQKGEQLGKKRKSRWGDFGINLIGEKVDMQIHFCDGCDLPIKIYGRIIPCKHAFCFDCAQVYDKNGARVCPGCGGFVVRIEKHMQGSIFVCPFVQGCKRTYLSQGSLDAHITYYHRVARRYVRHSNYHPHYASSAFKYSGLWMGRGRRRPTAVEKYDVMSSPSLCAVPFSRYHQPHGSVHAPAVHFSPRMWVRQETTATTTSVVSNLATDPVQKF